MVRTAFGVLLGFGTLIALPSIASAGYTQIAVANEDGCVIDDAGKVSCWGRAGSTKSKDSLRVIPGIDDAVAVSTQCALRKNGEVRCWTQDGSAATVKNLASDVVALNGRCVVHKSGGVSCVGRDLKEAYAVAGYMNVAHIAIGEHHTCVARKDGTVGCRGSNGDGQLGRLSNWSGPADMAAPDTGGTVDVPGIADAIAVGAGNYFSCALHRSGEVSCWGSPGALGAGATAIKKGVVVRVRGITDAVSLHSGPASTCVRRKTGAVACWGANSHGSISSSDGHHAAPTAVNAFNGAQALALGTISCAITAKGVVRCMGPMPRNEPQLLPMKNMVALAAGADRSCAIDGTGQLWCWGNVLDERMVKPSKMRVRDAVKLDMAPSSSCSWEVCVIRRNGQAACSKRGSRGTESKFENIGLKNTAALAVGQSHACALDTKGQAHCWGANDYGMRGDAGLKTSTVVHAVPGMSNATAIAVTSRTSCVSRQGQVFCWGEPLSGSGRPKRTERLGPRRISMLTDVVGLSASFSALYALRKSGKAYRWGFRVDPYVGPESPFAEVSGITSGKTISKQCVLTQAGGLSCWNRWAKTVATGFTHVDHGSRHSCALRKDKRVVCWGENTSGQLGTAPAPGVAADVFR